MKKNRANYFTSSSLETLLLALVLGLLTVMAAKANNNPDLNSLNGLFALTQAERFFQAGTEDFKREIKIFTHPERYLRDDLLKINRESSARPNLERKSASSQLNDRE